MPTVFLYTGEATANNVKLRDPTQLADIGGIAVNALAAQTLGLVTQNAIAQLVASASADQTLDDLSQSASVAAIVAASASQTLADLSQSATMQAIVVAAAAQTLGDLGQTTTAVAIAAVSAGQSLDAVTQAAQAAVVNALSASQTLDGIGQILTTVAVVSLAADQPLDSISQSAIVTVDSAAIVASATQALEGLLQSATAVHAVIDGSAGKPIPGDPIPSDVDVRRRVARRPGRAADVRAGRAEVRRLSNSVGLRAA